MQLERLENQILKSTDKIDELRSKMDSLKDQKIPTQEYKEISVQIEKAEQKFNKLLEKQELMQREGKDHGVVWDRLSDQIDEVGNEIRYAQGELQDLVDTGKAFTLGQDTDQFSKLGQQLQYAENNLSALNKQHKILEQKVKKTQGGYAKLGDTAKKSFEKINSAQNRSISLLGSFGKQLKSILAATFIFNSIRKAINLLTEGIKEGFKNFYEENAKFRSSIDSLKASATTLKNSLAAAFAPLVEIAIPYIQRFIEWLTKAVNLIGQFIAALTGRKTYTRAIKQTAKASNDAAKATKKEAEATEEAQEAAEGYLSPLDEINKYRKEEIKSTQNPKISDAEDEIPEDGVGTMFEEIPIDSRILDFLQRMKNLLEPIIDYAKKLKDIFMQGFWDGLGDWEYRWESIKNSIASIKDSLIDIFTDPAVLAAADGWAQSVAYMLGSLAGSVASIGLTIATNLLGGIETYLKENKERIKKYFVSMFDIGTEINNTIAELSQSIAYIFEAFASPEGIQLTANILGIVLDTLMGISEIGLKVARDILNIFAQPVIDNAEGFRIALEGILGVLASITGTIKQGIDDTIDKLNEVYDEHFKPFFDSVAQGLSDLVGKFMEFWNGNVQPILNQMAANFDTLWQSHIQPLLNNAAEFLGKVADLLKALWENILQPLIAWIIENILPKILPVIQAIWDTLVDFFAYFADLINSAITMLGGIVDFLTGVFTGNWELAFQGLQDIFTGFVEFIQKSIEAAIEIIVDLVKAFWEAIKADFEMQVEAILDGVETFLNWIKENVINKGEEIKQGFVDFLSGIKETWDKAWNSLKEKVSSIIEEIKSAIQSAFDWIAEKVNAIGEKLSSIGSKAKSIFSGSIFGGSSFSFSSSRVYSRMAMPTYQNPVIASLSKIDIPAYATGQVIPRTMRQHLAILGDNNQETEVVSPLSTMKEALKQALIEMGGISRGNSQPIILKVILDGKDILYAMVKEGKIVQMSTGKNIFALE